MRPGATFTPHEIAKVSERGVCTTFTMSVAADGLNDIYEALERYDWDNDIEFQAGLQAILGSNSTPEQAAELALRARCFYYARYGCYSIAFEALLFVAC